MRCKFIQFEDAMPREDVARRSSESNYFTMDVKFHKVDELV